MLRTKTEQILNPSKIDEQLDGMLNQPFYEVAEGWLEPVGDPVFWTDAQGTQRVTCVFREPDREARTTVDDLGSYLTTIIGHLETTRTRLYEIEKQVTGREPRWD